MATNWKWEINWINGTKSFFDGTYAQFLDFQEDSESETHWMVSAEKVFVDAFDIVEKIQVETGCDVQDIVIEHDALTGLLFPQIEQIETTEKTEKAFRVRDYRAQVEAFGEIVDWLEK